MWGFFSSRTAAIATATVLFMAAAVLPLVVMMGNAVTQSAYTALLLDARQRALLYNTTVVGLSTATLATIIGMPLGIALARIDLPWKRTLRVLLAAPMLLPPYVAALAWVALGTASKLASAWTYSMPGAVIVMALVFYPVSMLATEVAVRRIEPNLEGAALIVMRPGRVLQHITLRLATPSIVAAALLIFVLAISEFGVPALLRVRVFTTEVFTAFAALYDFDRATLLALPLLLLSMVVAAIAAAVAGERLVTTSRGLATGDAAPFHSWKSAGGVAAALMVTLALIVPLALLVREAVGVRSWVAVVEGSGVAIGNSLWFATVGATLTTAVGFVLGYGRARAQRRVGFLADLAFVVLFSVPSTIVGVGLISLWNQPGPLGALYGTDAMLVLGYLARFLPVAALGMAAAVRQVPASHEEAAATTGAGWAPTVIQIVVPQVSGALIAVWVVVFVLAFGELGASILVAPPGESTLPIRIYTLIANAPPAQVAALALLQSAVIISPLLFLAWGIAARETR